MAKCLECDDQGQVPIYDDNGLEVGLQNCHICWGTNDVPYFVHKVQKAQVIYDNQDNPHKSE